MEYKQQLEFGRSVFKKHDPYGLFAGGAPIDEFDKYINGVLSGLASKNSKEDVAGHLQALLFEGFESEEFDYRECLKIVEEIEEKIK